jgi:hypothetical protein
MPQPAYAGEDLRHVGDLLSFESSPRSLEQGSLSCQSLSFACTWKLRNFWRIYYYSTLNPVVKQRGRYFASLHVSKYVDSPNIRVNFQALQEDAHFERTPPGFEVRTGLF